MSNEHQNGEKANDSLKKRKIFKKPLPKKVKRIVVIFVALLLAGAIGFTIYSQSKLKTASLASTVNAMVTRGPIQVKIEGSGSVEPIERYDIMPLVKGTILTAPLEEGDAVKDGDLLYEIDYSDVTTEIEKAQNTLEKLYNTQADLNESIRNLNVYASATGKLTGMTLKVGDNFSSNGGKIAEITDVMTLVAAVPFSKAQLDNLYIGQTVTIGIEQYMQTVSGTVHAIGTVSKASGYGSILTDVEIHINAKEQNCEGIKEGTKVTAAVQTANGEIKSPSYGEISYPETVLLVAKAGGTVDKLYAKNNDWVEKGQLIASFENTSLTDQLKTNNLDIKDAISSLNSRRESLDDYIITSPIDGVVITKNYKKGDNLQLGNNGSTIIMTVADMSKMIFYIAADELDIAKIQIGQSVKVEADALPGQEFDAEVTQIATEGTSENGVATYQVKVTINNPEGLLPGMNVTGEIIIEEKLDTLMVPVSAVTARGGRYFVYRSTNPVESKKPEPQARAVITAFAAPADNIPAGEGQAPERPVQGEAVPGRDNTRGSDRPRQEGTGEAEEGQAFNKGENKAAGQNPGTPQASGDTGQNKAATAGNREEISERIMRQLEANKPENTKIVEVEVGINNDEYIEILSGLSEGDIVVITGVSTELTGNNAMRNSAGMGSPNVRVMDGGGGASGGRMQGGGMPGGR